MIDFRPYPPRKISRKLGKISHSDSTFISCIYIPNLVSLTRALPSSNIGRSVANSDPITKTQCQEEVERLSELKERRISSLHSSYDGKSITFYGRRVMGIDDPWRDKEIYISKSWTAVCLCMERTRHL